MWQDSCLIYVKFFYKERHQKTRFPQWNFHPGNRVSAHIHNFISLIHRSAYCQLLIYYSFLSDLPRSPDHFPSSSLSIRSLASGACFSTTVQPRRIYYHFCARECDIFFVQIFHFVFMRFSLFVTSFTYFVCFTVFFSAFTHIFASIKWLTMLILSVDHIVFYYVHQNAIFHFPYTLVEFM